jgi:hypothetical protein
VLKERLKNEYRVAVESRSEVHPSPLDRRAAGSDRVAALDSWLRGRRGSTRPARGAHRLGLELELRPRESAGTAAFRCRAPLNRPRRMTPSDR